MCFLLAFGCGLVLTQAAPSHSIARVWNEEILAAIRVDLPHPPVHARNLFHLSVAMYDAWAAYDHVAVGTSTTTNIQHSILTPRAGRRSVMPLIVCSGNGTPSPETLPKRWQRWMRAWPLWAMIRTIIRRTRISGGIRKPGCRCPGYVFRERRRASGPEVSRLASRDGRICSDECAVADDGQRHARGRSQPLAASRLHECDQPKQYSGRTHAKISRVAMVEGSPVRDGARGFHVALGHPGPPPRLMGQVTRSTAAKRWM